MSYENFTTPVRPTNPIFGTVGPTPYDKRGGSMKEFKQGVKNRLPESIREGIENVDSWIKKQLLLSHEDSMRRFAIKFGGVILITFVMVWIVYLSFQFLQCKGLEKLQKESETFSFPSSLFKKATWWMFFFLFLIYFTMTFSELVLENIIFVLRRGLGNKRKWIPRDLLSLQQFAILTYIVYQIWISAYPTCMNGIVADVIQRNIWILASPSLYKLCKGLWKLIQSHPKDSFSIEKYTQKIIQFIIDLVLPFVMYYFIIKPFQVSCSMENEKNTNSYATYYTTVTFVVYIFLSLGIEHFFSMMEFYKEFKIQVSSNDQILLFNGDSSSMVDGMIQCDDREELIKTILVLRSEFGNITNSKLGEHEEFPEDVEYYDSLNRAKNDIFPSEEDLFHKSLQELKTILWRAYIVFRQTLWNTNLFWKIAYENRDKTDITQFPTKVFHNKDDRNNYFNNHSILKIAYQDPFDPAFERSRNLVSKEIKNKINYTFLKEIINPKNYKMSLWETVFDELKNGTYYELMALLLSRTYNPSELSYEISPSRPSSTYVNPQRFKQEVKMQDKIEIIYRRVNVLLLSSIFVGIVWILFLVYLFQNRHNQVCSLRIFGFDIPQWGLFLLVLVTMILWSIAIHVLKFVVSTQHFPEIPR
uniref:Uncharacterized protein n=1 Tax=viral metagenome TaxID=1070528 RepID=A0A6C0D2B8_9ZZZZ